MAVRHGYGKIAGTDALVFAYDTGDARNSYKGEPTVNLISNPIVGDYGNAPGSSTTTISPDGTNNATIPIPNAAADRYQEVVAGGSYSSGTQFTYSWHYKQLATHTGITPNEPGGLYIYGLVNCSLVGSATKIKDLSNGWSRWKATFQITDGSLESIFRLYFGYVVGVDGSSAAYYGHQFEQKSYATPFVNGTRSSTQGLIDLTGNSTINLANVSFDSNARKVFDGTDDLMSITADGITDYSQPFTMECVFKVDSGATWDNGYRSNIFGIAGSYAGMYGLYKNNNSGVGIQVRDATTTAYAIVSSGLSKGVYYHLVGTWDGTSQLSLYLNGELAQNTTATMTGAPDTPNLYIGGLRAYGGAGGNYYQGEIPVAKYYRKVLTADEVRNNYRHYKTRFDIQ